MTGRDRRARDPLWMQQVLARLARIKVAGAARQTEEVRQQWDERRDNIIESIYLRQIAERRGGADEHPDR